MAAATTFLRCLGGSLGLTACFAGAGVAQVSDLPAQRAQLFATCEGRFAALSQHYRDSANVDLVETEAMHRQFADLLEATLPDAVPFGVTTTVASGWRDDGRRDISELILSIRLGVTLERAADANTSFVEKLQLCAALLLPEGNQ